MATVSDRTSNSLAVPPWGKEGSLDSKSEQYLARRFAAASADSKAMALATFLLALAVALVGWFVAGVLLEHWLVPGGLPDWVRWAWFGAAVAGTGLAIVRWLVPLVWYRVNLVYAARALERDHPELHNDLVNAVLVKERSGEAADAVLKSLRRRAARQLSRVPDEGVEDRAPAIRLAWALAALVCLTIVYGLLAPKSLVASATRLAAPWTGLAPPARVRIEPPQLAWRLPGEPPGPIDRQRQIDVVNGTAELVRGRQLVVTAEITGLKGDERPLLSVTPLRDDGTVDAAATPWQMAMTAAGAGLRTAVLPDHDRGLDHGVELVIAAGDGRSRRVRVRVVDAPTLMVRELRYDYPEYMGRESEILPWQGDIRGAEGTRVTIVAEANRPLERAAIDLDCDGRGNQSLALDKPVATSGKVSLTLELDAERTAAKHSSYRFIYRPRVSGGQRSEADLIGQVEHRIEVLPDLAPEVVIEAPEQKVLRVPPDAPVTVRVRAVDPDFGLASVQVETRLADEPIRRGDELLVGKPRRNFRGAATLVPQALGAKPGSVLEYRAVARDTRPDKPNLTVTEWQTLEIDPSAPPQDPPPPQPGEQDEPGEEPGQGDQPDGEKAGENAGGEGDPGENAGDAGGNQQGQGEGQMEQAAGEGQQGQGEGRESQPQQGEGQQGEGQQGEGQKGEGQKGEGQKGEGQKGEGQKGEGQQGEGQQGEGQQGEGQQGEGQQGEGQQGEGQKGEGQKGQGEGRESQPQQGEGQKGEGQKGEGQKGEAQKGQGEGRESQPQKGEAAGQEQPRPKQTVAADGTDDGEAMERILDDRRREKGEEPGQNNQKQQPQDDAGEQPKSGDPQAQKPDCCDADGKPCGKEGCSSCSGGKSGQGQSGQGEGQQGQGQQGEGEGREGQPGEGQPGQGEQGQGKGEPGQGQQGEGEGREGQPQQGQGEQGQGEPGQGEPGQGEQGQGEQGQGEQGQGEQGQQPGEPGGDAQGRVPGEAGDGPDPAGGEQGHPDAEAAAGEGQVGLGGQTGGSDQPAAGGNEPPPFDRRELEWTDQNLEHARNATDLALEHLRDSLDRGRTEVLDDLGWTPEQARAFLDRWEQMKRMAASDKPRERAEFGRALQSLGLRPDGVQSSRSVPTDVKGGQAEGRRSRPPSDYREQFKAFLRGTSGE